MPSPTLCMVTESRHLIFFNFTFCLSCFVFVLFLYFLFFYFFLFNFFLSFFIFIIIIFISFDFFFISFHFILRPIFFLFFFFNSFPFAFCKIKSKRNQIIITWPRADIAPKINHDGQELTYALRFFFFSHTSNER